MIDVTGLNATEGDRVCLFGNDPSQLKALSSMADTIEYESLCLNSARVPRIPR
jgi:alanine racemase